MSLYHEPTEEEKEASWQQLLDGIVETINDNLVVNDGDYYNDDGILICGVCGEPKTCKDAYYNGRYVKVQCKCERDAEAEKEEEEKKQKHLKAVKAIRDDCGIPARFANATFEAFTVNKSNKSQYEYCRKYAERFGKLEDPIGILMTGKVGTGKTYAAACIGNYLIEQEVVVVMSNVITILDEFRDPEKSKASLFSKLVNADLLILDDLGAEHSTDYAIERLYSVINERYMRNNPTIVATNLTFDSMASCDDLRYARIYNRILETSYPLSFTGKNWRMDIAYKNYQQAAKTFGNQ